MEIIIKKSQLRILESKMKLLQNYEIPRKRKLFENKEFGTLMDISYDVNPEVTKLQKFLVDKGYYIGRFGKKRDGIDGKYGPFTKAAHVAYIEDMSPEKFEKERKEIAQEFIGDVEDITLKNEFNFHLIPDGKNNFRSGQIPVLVGGKDYLGEVIDKYGIKTIIRLNYDDEDAKHLSSHPETSIESERKVAQAKGVNFEKLRASSKADQDLIEDYLSRGNTLIHCAHGADRTGGAVGAYLKNNGFGDTKKVWDYTTKYNSWNSMVFNKPQTFMKKGYFDQAKKFGVRDLQHAQELASGKKSTYIERPAGSIPENIIIGDSQVKYVDMNTQAERISTKQGEEFLNKGGETLSWLTSAVKKFPVSPSVKNVVIVIGTNGVFGKYSSDDVPGLFSALKRKFPNAKFIAVQGSWGWSKGNMNVKIEDVKNYYQKFADEGAIVIDPPIGNIEPHQNHEVYSQIGRNIDQYL